MDNTVRKWLEVRNAILRANRIQVKGGASRVTERNAPSYNYIMNKVYNALEHYEQNETNQDLLTFYFLMYPGKRALINQAHTRIGNLRREMEGVARKVMAARKIQTEWKKKRSAIMNKRKLTALATLSRSMGRVGSHISPAVFKTAFPKKVFGPKTLVNTSRERSKYHNY